MNRNDGDGTNEADGRSDYESQRTDLEPVGESEIEQAGENSLDRQEKRDGSASSPDRTRRTRNVENNTVSDIAESLGGQSVTVETDSITATLVGVPEIDLHEFVYDHQLTVDHDPDERRTVVMFDLENTGKYPVKWRTSRTRFIGTDGYTYQPSQLSLDPSRLGPGCHTRQVEIEPNRRARVVTLVEQLPSGVELAEVVHKITPLGESQRLAFAVE